MDIAEIRKKAYAFMVAAEGMTVELARKILQVEPSVDRRGVEDAFRRLEKAHHPYKPGGDLRRFRGLLEAKKRLLDEIPVEGVLEEVVEEPEEMVGEVIGRPRDEVVWGDWYEG